MHMYNVRKHDEGRDCACMGEMGLLGLHSHVKLSRAHVKLLHAHVNLLRVHVKGITCAREKFSILFFIMSP